MKNLPTIYSEGNISPVSTAPTADEDDQNVSVSASTSATTPTTEASNGVNDEDEEDQRAALEASRHREHAQNLVREHLENHVAHNPGASSDYITWIATLHPENADITIDYRFFLPGNPWWTIYEDTKNNPIPIATAVPVVSNLSDTVREEEDLEQGGEKNDPEQPLSREATTKEESPHCCLTCNPLALVAALVIIAPAAAAVLAMELLAFLFLFVPATLFYQAGQAFAPPNICTCLLYLVFMTLYNAMVLAESILLLASVLFTECIGMVGLLVGFLTGGCLWATHLQQSIRRTCHGIRITFRHNGSDSRSSSSSSPTLPTHRSLFCCRKTKTSLERERKANREKGVRVVNVQRVRRPGESCH